MTLVALWIRRNYTLRELVIAADSRLSGGESWDACPKIINFPRPATVMAMSGDATAAYAFLLQAINASELLDGHKSGRTDIGSLARSIWRVLNDSRRHVVDLPNNGEQEVPVVDVVLAGWSWRHLRFEAFSYRYDKEGALQMHAIPLKEDSPNVHYFAGDAAGEARRRLLTLMQERGVLRPMRGARNAQKVARECFLDWEPLEILTNIIEDPTIRSVGGSPQVYRIYQYGEAEGFVWNGEGGYSFGGRIVLEEERFDRRVMSQRNGKIEVSPSPRSIVGGSKPPDAAPW